MSGRRRSAADLPRAPLELLHPMTVQGGAVVGAEIASEPTAPHTATLLRLYRALLAASADAPDPAELDQGALRAMEADLLARMEEDPLAAPLAVLTAALLKEEDDRARVTWACLCVSDWAIERGATSTAVSFAQLAALLWPQHARYAWVTAKMLRRGGQASEAETWFRRAHRVAVWTDDWETQARSLNSLGNLHLALGRFRSSKNLHLRALRVCRRNQIIRLAGEISHDLFVVHAEMGEPKAAEVCVAEALSSYIATAHPRLRMLGHDLAQFWTEQGYHWRTLPIFTALLPWFPVPEERIRVLAGAARAAGLAGLSQRFDDFAREVAVLAEQVNEPRTVAGALYEVAAGALSLGDVVRGRELLERARSLADSCKATDISTRVEVALGRIFEEGAGKETRLRTRTLDPGQRGDLLALDIVRTLESEVMRSSSTLSGTEW